MKLFFLSLLLPLLVTAVGDLPSIDKEFSLSMYAADSKMTIRSAMTTVDFRGGIKVRVIEKPDDKSVRLKVIGFRVTAELADMGTIKLEQDDVEVAAKSMLVQTQQSLTKIENTFQLSFGMVINQPNYLRKRDGLMLTTKNPMVLVSTLAEFPPNGDLYRLQAPVDLIAPDDADVVIATILAFPAKMGRS